MQKQEFCIELSGIIGTIHTYTRNPFMLGYTRELRKAMFHNDLDSAKIAIDKVISWYQSEIDKIISDDYIFNKTMHEKAYGILIEYRKTLES